MWARPNLKPWVTEPDKLVQYDGIVAYKSDRLSRAEWSDEIQIRLWAQEHGKELFSVHERGSWLRISDVKIHASRDLGKVTKILTQARKTATSTGTDRFPNGLIHAGDVFAALIIDRLRQLSGTRATSRPPA